MIIEFLILFSSLLLSLCIMIDGFKTPIWCNRGFVQIIGGIALIAFSIIFVIYNHY
jgi:hypothetical protein